MSCVLVIIGFDATNRLMLDNQVIESATGNLGILGPCTSPICTKSTALIAGLSTNPAESGQWQMFLTDDVTAKPAEAYVIAFDTKDNAVAFANAHLSAEAIKGKIVLFIDGQP